MTLNGWSPRLEAAFWSSHWEWLFLCWGVGFILCVVGGYFAARLIKW